MSEMAVVRKPAAGRRNGQTNRIAARVDRNDVI